MCAIIAKLRRKRASIGGLSEGLALGIRCAKCGARARFRPLSLAYHRDSVDYGLTFAQFIASIREYALELFAGIAPDGGSCRAGVVADRVHAGGLSRSHSRTAEAGVCAGGRRD